MTDRFTAEEEHGMWRGSHACVDPRINEPFNNAVRGLCARFGYSPSSDAIDALKRDLDYGHGPVADWRRRWAQATREGKMEDWVDKPDSHRARTLTGLMLAIGEVIHGPDAGAFVIEDLVTYVKSAVDRANQRDLEQMR